MINRIFFEFSAKKREKKLKNVILVQEIKKLLDDYKQKFKVNTEKSSIGFIQCFLRPLFGAKYNHELLNNLFRHPYTKIEYIGRSG